MAARAILAGAVAATLGAATALAQSFTPSARPKAMDPSGGPRREGPIYADGAGKVVGFLDPAEALSMRMRTEMMLRAQSDPALRDNPRAVIEVPRPLGPSREIAVVPDGVTVDVGESVEFDGGYWDPGNPCAFVPNLVRKAPATG